MPPRSVVALANSRNVAQHVINISACFNKIVSGEAAWKVDWDKPEKAGWTHADKDARPRWEMWGRSLVCRHCLQTQRASRLNLLLLQSLVSGGLEESMWAPGELEPGQKSLVHHTLKTPLDAVAAVTEAKRRGRGSGGGSREWEGRRRRRAGPPACSSRTSCCSSSLLSDVKHQFRKKEKTLICQFDDESSDFVLT